MTALDPGAVVAGRYTIVKKLGEGGMGAVYRAVQEPLGREVALKVIAPALAVDGDAVARFQREAKASSALTHPNIVTVYDFGKDGQTLFIAMELLSGQALDALVSKGPTPPARAITILRGICAALAEAHGKGIVHRDLKPQNVMLSSTSMQDDIAKVVDFGIAKMKDGGKTLTMTGAVVGTPGYVAPELFDGKEPSAQSDLYALGVVAYELLCGNAPFPGKTPMEMIKAALFTEPLPMRAFLRDVPLGLEQLVRDLLHKDPAMRPASARVVDERLAALQHGPQPTSQSHNDLAPDQSTEMNIERVDDPTQQKPPSSTSNAPPPNSSSSNSSSSNSLKAQNEPKHLVEALPSSSSGIVLTPPKPPPATWGAGKVFLAGCAAFFGVLVFLFFVAVVVAIVNGDANDEDAHNHAVDADDVDTAVAALPAPGSAFFADAGVDLAKVQKLLDQIDEQQRQREEPVPPPPPERTGPQTEVVSPEAMETLLGTHPFTLQWISWDYTGKATITDDNGLLRISARQDGRADARGYVATIEGVITKVEEDRFVVDGVASSRIGHIAGGRPCAHKSKALVFKATSGRKYWRLSQMDSPCDGVTDYFDVYFAQVAPAATTTTPLKPKPTSESSDVWR